MKYVLKLKELPEEEVLEIRKALYELGELALKNYIRKNKNNKNING